MSLKHGGTESTEKTTEIDFFFSMFSVSPCFNYLEIDLEEL